MLKAAGLDLCKKAWVKTHLIHLYWNKWVTADEMAIELNCTLGNIEQHIKSFYFYNIRVDSRIVGGKRREYKIGNRRSY